MIFFCILAIVLEKIDNHTEIVHLKFSTNICIIKKKKDFIILIHWYQKDDSICIVMNYLF